MCLALWRGIFDSFALGLETKSVGPPVFLCCCSEFARFWQLLPFVRQPFRKFDATLHHSSLLWGCLCTLLCCSWSVLGLCAYRGISGGITLKEPAATKSGTSLSHCQARQTLPSSALLAWQRSCAPMLKDDEVRRWVHEERIWISAKLYFSIGSKFKRFINETAHPFYVRNCTYLFVFAMVHTLFGSKEIVQQICKIGYHSHIQRLCKILTELHTLFGSGIVRPALSCHACDNSSTTAVRIPFPIKIRLIEPLMTLSASTVSTPSIPVIAADGARPARTAQYIMRLEQVIHCDYWWKQSAPCTQNTAHLLSSDKKNTALRLMRMTEHALHTSHLQAQENDAYWLRIMTQRVKIAKSSLSEIDENIIRIILRPGHSTVNAGNRKYISCIDDERACCKKHVLRHRFDQDTHLSSYTQQSMRGQT